MKRYGRFQPEAGNARKSRAFKGPKALHPPSVAAHALLSLPLALLFAAGSAIQGPVASGDEPSAAENAPFPVMNAAGQFGAQFPVGGENGGFEIATDQSIGDGLRTDAALPVVQQEAVSSVIVCAQAAYELFHAADLSSGHAPIL